MAAEPAFSGVLRTQTVVATDAAGMVSEMKKCRKNAGFTMVELLTVVAILTILMGVAAVSVIKYQRSLKGKEADSAAKEIFIAAQNHLTAASALGELTTTDANGNQVFSKGVGTAEEDVQNQYILAGPSDQEMLKIMLPFGAIDEQVRSGGSYIIHYNLKTATVLDVFYSDASDSRFGATLAAGNYADLASGYAGDSNRDKRRNATVGDQSKRVIGWYGGAKAGELGSYDNYLKEPTIKVTNGDTLRVEVSALAAKTGNLKSSASLSLIVTGVNSKAMKEIKLKGSLEGGGNVFLDSNTESIRKEIKSGATLLGYLVTLDDITVGRGNFYNVMMNTGDSAIPNIGGRNGTFIPGEDLDIRAVAFDNGSLSNIAESGTVRVNSLFGSNVLEDTTAKVTVSSIRHLENLESAVSSVDWDAIGAVEVTQTSDLDWTTFNKDYWEKYVRTTNTDLYPYGEQKIYKAGVDPGDTAKGKFLSLTLGQNNLNPPKTGKKVQYMGDNHQIRNLTIEGGGLFSELNLPGSKVENLDLVNFKVESANNAGALAATATDILTNVKVYNDLTDDSALSITGKDSVGGLVGEFSGSAKGCAAAVYVNSTEGSAGGLFGKAKQYTAEISVIQNSYSGGHIKDGRYTKKQKKANTADEYEETLEGRINVQGATAGGLIGTLSGEESVVGCYSTCSVGGTTAGGFVGKAEGTSTTNENCYCTGLVAVKDGASYKLFTNPNDETKIGTFVGAKTSSKPLSGRYLEIVNYRSMKEEKGSLVAAKSTDQMKPIGTGGTDSDSITPFDDTAANYNTFIGYNPIPSVPYDTTLLTKAEKDTNNAPQFGLRPTTGQTIHYGDWPLYETLVVNT